MADILIDNQSGPSTPASGKSVVFVDSTSKRLSVTDDTGVPRGGALSSNSSVAQQTGFAADTWLTSSDIIIPSYGMKVGQVYCWEVGIEKTAAGVAVQTVNVRVGSARTTADTSRAALVSTVAQTATASVVIMFVRCMVRTVSASGVVVAMMGCTSTAGSATSGFGDGDRIVSATWDNTAVAGQYVSLSINGGTAASYTIDYVTAWLQA
jgi:hypothetical protein